MNLFFDSIFKKNLLKSKHSQVTIFIILALGIAIILVLLFINKNSLTIITYGESPVNQIKDCVKETSEQALDILSMQGGSISPKNYYLYQGNKVEYLCYTEEDYKKCVMQKPLLKQSIEKELTEFIKPKTKNCINSVKESLIKKGYSVSSKEPEITAEIIPNNVLIDIKSDLKIKKSKTENYKSIKININSKLYDFIMIASSISNWEARYGDSEIMNYMIYYPSLKVEKKKQDEGTTIYILTDKISLDKFMFASRSLALSAGLTGE